MKEETCVKSWGTGLYGFKVPENITKLKFVVKDNYKIKENDISFKESFIISVPPKYDFSRGIYAKVEYWYNIDTEEYDFSYKFYYYPDSPNDNFSDSVLYTRLLTKYKFYPYNYKERKWKKVYTKIIPFEVYYSDEINKEPSTCTIPNDSTNDDIEINFVTINTNPIIEWKSMKSRRHFGIMANNFTPRLVLETTKDTNLLVIQPKCLGNFKELQNKSLYLTVDPDETYFIYSIKAIILHTKQGNDYIDLYMEYKYKNSFHSINLFKNYDDDIEKNLIAFYNIDSVFSTIKLCNAKNIDGYKNLSTDYDVYKNNN